MTADQVDSIHAAVLRRHVDALSMPLVNPAGLRQLQRELAADRRAFANEVELLAFLLAAFKLLERAKHSVDRADAVSLRIEHLEKFKRAALGRTRRLSKGSVLVQAGCANGRPMQPCRRGRKNETALRDIVVRILCDLYPAHGRSAQRWPIACRLARLVWPMIPDAADLRRDMRRRLAQRRQVDSPALAAFLSGPCPAI